MENDDEFGTSVTFAKRDSSQSVTVNCLTNKIMVDVEGNGGPAVSERTTVAVHENTLTEAGYTVRNNAGNIAMTSDLVTILTGFAAGNYTVKYQIPDQKFGCLVFVLESYSA